MIEMVRQPIVNIVSKQVIIEEMLCRPENDYCIKEYLSKKDPHLLWQREYHAILQGIDEYYDAAEPPVRCGESRRSGLTEPHILLLLCLILVKTVSFSHRDVFGRVDTFNVDFVCIIDDSVHDGICQRAIISSKTFIPTFLSELRTEDRG